MLPSKLFSICLVVGIVGGPFSGWPLARKTVIQPRPPAFTLSSITDPEFLFAAAPFSSAHASTIVETREGLVAAWFGGTREGAADVGIWLSRRVRGEWAPPVEGGTGTQPDGTRYPCWNPVLFEMPDQTLTLFYKVGATPQSWWGMVRTSRDNGRTWT